MKHLQIVIFGKEQFSNGLWPLILWVKESRWCSKRLVLVRREENEGGGGTIVESVTFVGPLMVMLVSNVKVVIHDTPIMLKHGFFNFLLSILC